MPAKSATEPASSQRSSYKAGGLMVRLGRVKFADLEEGEVLGEGTFGTVLSGRYRGRDVAVKKARGAIGSSSITEAFRWAGWRGLGPQKREREPAYAVVRTSSRFPELAD